MSLSLHAFLGATASRAPPTNHGRILEGILIQAVGLARVNDMIPYHFFIIWMLSLLSTAANFACLLALVQDYKRDWVLRWLRQFAMFVNMALGIVFGIFVLEVSECFVQPLPNGFFHETASDCVPCMASLEASNH